MDEPGASRGPIFPGPQPCVHPSGPPEWLPALFQLQLGPGSQPVSFAEMFSATLLSLFQILDESFLWVSFISLLHIFIVSSFVLPEASQGDFPGSSFLSSVHPRCKRAGLGEGGVAWSPPQFPYLPKCGSRQSLTLGPLLLLSDAKSFSPAL